MSKRLLMAAVVLLVGAGLTLAAPAGKEGTWSGVISDTSCGASNTKADCVTMCVKEHGAKYALVDSKSKKVYVLNPQEDAAKHAGHTVTVKGSVDGDTITATSITMPSSPSGN
ncbi:MAG: hypothetical protein ACRD5L_13715 [Bryobacteraceae bacterium]